MSGEPNTPRRTTAIPLVLAVVISLAVVAAALARYIAAKVAELLDPCG